MKLQSHPGHQAQIDELNQVIPESPAKPTRGTEKQIKYASGLLDKASQVVGVLMLTKFSEFSPEKKAAVAAKFSNKTVDNASTIIDALSGISGHYAPELLKNIRANAGGSASQLRDVFQSVQAFIMIA